MVRRLVAFLLAALPALAVAQGADRAQLERRLSSVETLVERSSAARQIEASGSADAMKRRDEARERLRRAQEAFRASDDAAAAKLVAEASKLLAEATRMAAPETLIADKAQRDFEARLGSVDALLDAHRRIGAEKGDAGRAAETTRAIEAQREQAKQLRAAGRMEAARAALDQAYLIAKASVSSMRSGDTLVRSLHFATREEEYRYEIDRNDTHQMLIRVLLDGRRDAPGVQEQVAGRVEKARALRAEAERVFGGGDAAEAIRRLEESTGELVRAIRSAGVYIPG